MSNTVLEALLSQNEGKTLEFKENTRSLASILKTIISFANTAGGTIVVGVTDKKKSIVGVDNPLQEEERLASSIVDSIEPLIIPDIQILSIRNKELILIQVPHLVGPYSLKSVGVEHGTFVRVGSTNRLADSETILSLQMLAKNTSFDELPCMGATLDDEIINASLEQALGKISHENYASLGIVMKQHNKIYPTNGGVLLFCLDRLNWFPDASIACVCFLGETHEKILDQQEIKSPLIKAHEEVLAFIRRNTRLGANIHESTREDIPQYPPEAVREAVINAIVHADYAMKGSRIQLSIFSDRIEITNPGGLPYGQTIELALSGISRMRNRIMGRLFRETKLIERLGTGLKRIVNVYDKTKAKKPVFQELNTHFRVTLYSVDTVAIALQSWETMLIEELKEKQQLGTTEVAKFWGVTTRTARTRLKKMIDKGIIVRIGTSAKDPYAIFKVK